LSFHSLCQSFHSLCFVLSFLSFFVLCPFIPFMLMLYALQFKLYSLFFTNPAFFKYNKPINMKLYHSTMHNLNLNRSSHSNTLKIILPISSIHHFITSLILFEHNWNYSNQPKQIINIQLVRIYKTHIFCYSDKLNNNSFSVSKISPGCIGLTTPTLHWRTHWSLQLWHNPANTYNVRLRYGTRSRTLKTTNVLTRRVSHF